MIKISSRRVNSGNGKSKPSILSRPDSLETTAGGGSGSGSSPMPGRAQLSLPDHPGVISAAVGGAGDARLLLADGELTACSALLATVSPFLRQLLLEAARPGPADWVRDEFPVLSLPDVSRHQMELLLSLLSTGKANLYHRELQGLVNLTQTLKMVSIPVAISEEKWAVRSRPGATPSSAAEQRAVITFIPGRGTVRGRPAKLLSSQHERPVPPAPPTPLLQANLAEIATDALISYSVPVTASVAAPVTMTVTMTDAEKAPVTPTVTPTVTASVKATVPSDPVIALVREEEEESGSESDLEEFVEEMQVFVSGSGEVERLEMLGDPGETGRVNGEQLVTVVEAGQVTVLQAEQGEGLDGLISVAEAFERSQQPDFNDIASPVVDGTDTDKHLVRNCPVCSKALLGRNALGRHVKNVHPKVFGPYRCSFPGCGKSLESGVKVVAHMYQHTGGRTKLAQETPSWQCSEPGCSGVFASSSRLAEHRKAKHEITDTMQKQSFSCSAGDIACKEVFMTARNFIKHMKEKHAMKPWYCAPCDKRFMERQNLQFHLMSHGDKKNFACDICNKSFSNPRQLYTHRALHLGKRFLCQECGYRARSAANLRGHVKAKHEARQHGCHLCEKKFSSGNNLRNHLRVHTGEAPYACELCTVRFKRAHHLHSHIESKLHVDTMEKCRRAGQLIPQRLDPGRRVRGRPAVEDGPVTLAGNGPGEAEENCWPQVVVLQESQIEIIQESVPAGGTAEFITTV